MYTKYTRVDTPEEIESTQQGSESWEHFVLPQQDIYNTGLQRPLQIYVKPRVIKHKQRGGEQRNVCGYIRSFVGVKQLVSQNVWPGRGDGHRPATPNTHMELPVFFTSGTQERCLSPAQS